MAVATPQDAKKNEAMAHAMADNETPVIMAQVGMHALGKLTELMPHEEFAEFINGALQSATTGEPPAEDNEAAEGESSSQ